MTAPDPRRALNGESGGVPPWMVAVTVFGIFAFAEAHHGHVHWQLLTAMAGASMICAYVWRAWDPHLPYVARLAIRLAVRVVLWFIGAVDVLPEIVHLAGELGAEASIVSSFVAFVTLCWGVFDLYDRSWKIYRALREALNHRDERFTASLIIGVFLSGLMHFLVGLGCMAQQLASMSFAATPN
jgi:hypothetical protein